MVNEFMNKKRISVILLMMVIAGIFGFIYETIFYRIDLGYFVKRGITYGPWITIYAVGSLLIYLSTYKWKNSPLKVFLISGLVCGILELLTGYLLFKFNGERLWDYNIEIWNYGNIGGYICLRSVLFFAMSGLLLIYYIVPFIEKIYKKMPKEFTNISFILSFIFFIDTVISIIIK